MCRRAKPSNSKEKSVLQKNPSSPSFGDMLLSTWRWADWFATDSVSAGPVIHSRKLCCYRTCSNSQISNPSVSLAVPQQTKRALISVSDKTNLAEFGQGLAEAGFELISTGGTSKHLQEAGLQVQDVADYTGFPEMMDGRVKTLHPKVHGGLLCRRDNSQHMASADEHGIAMFDMVVVNLYPFEQTVARQDVALAEAIEQIDIGGPSMVRSAAKNHDYVTIVTSPSQYQQVLEELQSAGATTLATRRQLAGAAFRRTAEYDTAIARYFSERVNSDPEPNDEAVPFPANVSLSLSHRSSLRYGENPHQSAALYTFADAGPQSLVNAEQLNGKELSYNNLLDLNAALSIARSLPTPGVAVLKHNNPCGAATADTLAAAVSKAWDGDPVSAFGSVLGVNVPVDGPMADYLAEPGRFVEAIVAPDFTREALEILTTKPKWKANVRLLKVGEKRDGRQGVPGAGGRQARGAGPGDRGEGLGEGGDARGGLAPAEGAALGLGPEPDLDHRRRDRGRHDTQAAVMAGEPGRGQEEEQMIKRRGNQGHGRPSTASILA